MKKNISIKIIIIMVLLYIIDFVLVPLIYPCWVNAEIILFPSLLIAFFVGMIMISNKLRYWFLGDILYIILVYIYHGRGLYGIGMVGMNLDGAHASYRKDAVPFGIAILAIIVIIVQLVVWFIIKICKYILKRRKQKNILLNNKKSLQ